MKSHRAFTLIELLIVVAIIGILATIAVPNFLNARMRAMVTRTYSDLKALHSAMEMYRIDNNAYVPDYECGDTSMPMLNDALTYARLTSPVSYIASIPLDPFFVVSPAGTPHQKGVAYFQYAGLYCGQQDWSEWWGPSGTIYAMISLGPDKEDQLAWIYPHNLAYLVSYNLSNGLTSRGDIYMSNHGLVF